MKSLAANNTASTVPVIAGVEITTDLEGRFNLNALHKASGLGEDKSPSQWMRRSTTKALINELSVNSHLADKVINSIKGGVTPGTFAHELLAVSYAGWISPAFQLQVNQIFLDYRTGNLQSAPMALPSMKELALMVVKVEEEKELLTFKNQQLAQQVEVATPKVEFHDKVVAAHGAISLANAAKILGTGRNRLCEFMRHNGWLTRRNEPYQEKITAGLLDVKLGSWDHPDHGVQQSVTALVTGKGLAQLQRLLSNRSYTNPNLSQPVTKNGMSLI
ncbi:TPA: phage antirepressor KilAC domain-containing protein [Yersinia enterocolitica]|uniref:phage antirepressor KilAC domain-containing protein n=1 Tax=Yersinia enterocolitica TaxID=630 RepID=UPI00155A57FB|nr:phage antirepressor KilAC domain-containing protein [Yersinia enterocolitica]MBX9485665.1 phage antirepressor KilAC domain-containing protein [Yersinia enterocolitica]NQS93890.1 phage antirepressor KilAC domain-containing protein [Yersinia enterocolitica]NQT44363.1 phage antirepressor KilAC domain-containing protein [Yersinia enterocolitica]NQU02126.1 phage antirepressor KilAC domain-containing protein [Yersinia enterocolitica]HDL6953124.1 phage antirepressor KilAC domain-containing protein